jgi:hypothetical protein
MTYTDPVKQALAELQDLVRCRCHEAYKGRGLHDPDCHCDNADAVKVVADDLETLDKACKEWADVSQRSYQRGKAAEAKLAKAVEALEWFSSPAFIQGPSPIDCLQQGIYKANATLAKLKGDKP